MTFATAESIVVISLLVAFSTFPSVAASRTSRQDHFPAGSVAVAPGGVIFTGVGDGRILQYRGPLAGWRIFAYTTPTRETCDNQTEPDSEPVCGYPLGLAYNSLTGELYIADPYQGMMIAGPDAGMLATPLATTAEGVPFSATTAIDFDPVNGIIYFIDRSTKYRIRDSTLAIESNDTTGRLMQYDTNTRRVTVLLRSLGFPGGVAVSNDGSFVLVTETSLNKTTRFWVTGPKANTAEPFLTNIIRPENIKRTILGKFWIAAMVANQPSSESMVPIRVIAEEIQKRANGAIIYRTSLEPEFYGGVHVSEVYPVIDE
ncbi:Protein STRICTOSIDINE SYNTHASE-LIKE 10 [Linum grandiflorum]